MLKFIKLTWMFGWRLWLLSDLFNIDLPIGVFGLALTLAAIFRFALYMDIKTFPIIRLLGKKSPFIYLKDPDGYAPRPKPKPSQTQTTSGDPFAQRPIIQSSTKPGRKSGFEPRFLHNVTIPNIPIMRGTPGKGLNASGFGQAQMRTGQMGETNFAKALAVTDPTLSINYNGSPTAILNNVHSFWSVSMPNADFTRADVKLPTDIDCIFVNSNEILLVDTKFYKSGDVTYAAYDNTVYCVDNATGSLVGEPKLMTRNMEIAAERFKKAFPRMIISSMVVLVPTDSGAANVSNVFWPGQIPAVNIETALTKMSQFAQYASAPSANITHKINMLLK